MVKLPLHLDSIKLGTILSDGWLFINKSGNTLLAFKQSMDKLDYFFHVFNKLSHYCSANPRLTTTKINGKKFTGIVFATRVFPCFTEWYNVFYINKKKRVPLDLYNFLTYEALAYWIMGDGSKSNNSVTLQTHSLTVTEVVYIVNILMHKFNLKCSIHMQRNQPTIYIHSKSMKELQSKISCDNLPSMTYK
jgi:hypothetical protein